MFVSLLNEYYKGSDSDNKNYINHYKTYSSYKLVDQASKEDNNENNNFESSSHEKKEEILSSRNLSNNDGELNIVSRHQFEVFFRRTSFCHSFRPSIGISRLEYEIKKEENSIISPVLRVSKQGKFKDHFYRISAKNIFSNYCHFRLNRGNQFIPGENFFSDQDVVCSGYLYKLGSWRKNWKKRFFVLRSDNPCLLYFKSEDDLAILGKINIDETIHISDISRDHRPPFIFDICSNSRTLLLTANSRDDQLNWVNSIKNMIDSLFAKGDNNQTDKIVYKNTAYLNQKQSINERNTNNSNFNRKIEYISYPQLPHHLEMKTICDQDDDKRSRFQLYFDLEIKTFKENDIEGDGCIYCVAVEASAGDNQNQWKEIGRTEFVTTTTQSKLHQRHEFLRTTFSVVLITPLQCYSFMRFLIFQAFTSNGSNNISNEVLLGTVEKDVSILLKLTKDKRYVLPILLEAPRRNSLSIRKAARNFPIHLGITICTCNTSHYSKNLNGSPGAAHCKYLIPTKYGSLCIDECLIIPSITFQIPISYLQFLIIEKQNKIEGILKMQNELYLTKEPQIKLENLYQNQIENYKRCIDDYQQCLVFYQKLVQESKTKERNQFIFKKSTFKKDHLWRFICTNLQNQILHTCVNSTCCLYWNTITFGCAAGHSFGFSQDKHIFSKKSAEQNLFNYRKPVEDFNRSQRFDAISCQILSAAVSSIMSVIELAFKGSMDHQRSVDMMASVGFLFSIESLLSTQGREAKMLEDMLQAVQFLNNVMFRLESTANTENLSFDIGRYHRTHCSGLIITIFFKPQQFNHLPLSLQRGGIIQSYAVLFTQGINVEQILSNAFRNSSLQYRVNSYSLDILKIYFQKYQQILSQTRYAQEIQEISLMLDYLNEMIQDTKYEKNVNILVCTSDFCRAIGAGRLTCCKSGKDRTAMSVTLEQARILSHQLYALNGRNICSTMRLRGVRRKNVTMNTNMDKFAFSSFQRQLMPECYQPPIGAYKGGKA